MTAMTFLHELRLQLTEAMQQLERATAADDAVVAQAAGARIDELIDVARRNDVEQADLFTPGEPRTAV